MIFGWHKRLGGGAIDPQSDEMADIRSRLDKLKSRGGLEIDAHAHCNSNRNELAVSKRAGCFYCREVYDANEVDEWIDDDKCALCPKCSIDSVIGDASGFAVTDAAFLKRMHEIWF